MPAVASVPRYRLPVLLAGLVIVATAVSAWHPHDRATWFLETFWVLVGLPVIALTWRRFPLTILLCRLLAAFPGENANTQVIEEQGTTVATGAWDGESTAAQFAADVLSMRTRRAPANYATFETGTVLPPGSTRGGGSAHMATWRTAYAIPGLRDWIMRQSR